MFWRYGSHQHLPGEVSLESFDIRYRLSPRGKRLSKILTAYLLIEMQRATQDEITDAANQLIAVYSQDMQNLTFHQDSGRQTPHALLVTGDCISGVRVKQRSYPIGSEGSGEYATKRTMSVTLQAEYDDVEDNIVQWKEKIVYIGNCGPQFTDVQTFFGVITVRTALATPQRIIQSGTAIGWQGYVSPPGPYLPNLERPHVRRVELEGGQNMGLQARLYGTSWTYTMVATQPQTIFPATL